MAYHYLTYINDEGTYVLSEGSNDAAVQSLMIDDVVDDAIIDPDINLAENAQNVVYRRYRSGNHNYYTLSNTTYVNESGNEATNLPYHLTGWQLTDETPFSGAGETVDSTFINTYFDSGQESNLDIYAKWDNTMFVRVLVSTFDSAVQVDGGTFTVVIEDDDSYNDEDVYRLSDKFKRTVDYSHTSTHMGIKVNGNASNCVEVGNGDGCPISVNGTRYPTYFGVKPGNEPSLTLTIANSDLIPFYTMNQSNPEYVAFVCVSGLSRDCYDKSPDTLQFIPSNNYSTWTISSIGTVNSDKTIFIKLTQKPVIIASVCVSDTGKVAITDTSTQPSNYSYTANATKMPGESCYLWAQALNGYQFDGWYTNVEGTNTAPNDGNGNPYTTNGYLINPIDYSTRFYAKFTSTDYTITFLKHLS